MPEESPANHAALEEAQAQIAKLEAENASLKQSARRFREGAKSGGMALWEWDPNSQDVWLSEAWEEMLGVPLSEIDQSREGLRAILHPDDVHLVELAFQSHLEGGAPLDLQYRIRHVDGTYRRVRCRAQTVLDNAGVPMRLTGAVRDISDWFSSREELRRSQALLQQLVEASPVAMVIVSGGGEEILLRNHKFQELFGYSEADIPKVQDWWPLAYPDPAYRKEIFEAWNKRLEAAEASDHRLVPIETVVTCKDGSKRNIQFEATSLGGDQLVVFFDVTELRQSEMQFRQVTDAIDEAFFLTSADKSKGLFISPAFEEIFGLAREEFVARPSVIIDLAHPADRDALVTAFAMEKTEPCEMEFRIIRPNDGALRTVELSSFPVNDDNGSLYQIAGIFSDVTQDRELQKALLDAGELEKLALGSDIHDDVCNAMSGLSLIYGVKAKQLETSNPEAGKLINELLVSLKEISQCARMLAHGMPSVYLTNDTLLQAIETLMAKLRETYPTVELMLDAQDTTAELAPEMATQLYYIIREALRNALKHAQASRIEVTLWREGANFRVRVKDNGCGRAAAIEEGDQLGLRAMRYRVKVLGGSLQLLDNEGQGESGLQVNCRVPLPDFE